MLVKRYCLIPRHSPMRWSLSSFTRFLKFRRCTDAVASNITKITQRNTITHQYPNTAVQTSVGYIGSRNAGVGKDSLKKKVDLPYPEQKVRVYACEDLYERWRKERKFRRIPRSGVFTDVSYVDTMVNKEGEDKSMDSAPTVLCIHGIPGNYNVFSHLITELGNQGVRTVVPTFPNMLELPGKYGTELFRHSVEEKTEVFKSFLKALKLKELDAIVAHSSAIYPALRLALDPDLKVKCHVLFNTGGHKKPVSMRPYWVPWLWSKMYLRPSFRKLAIMSTKLIMKIVNTPIKDNDVVGILLLATTMVHSEYWMTKDQFQELAAKQKPTLLCFSEDDKVVERDLTYEVISLLGASKENISYYDANGDIITKGKPNSWLKLMSFQAGSHYVFRKYPNICNQEVLEILRKVKTE